MTSIAPDPIDVILTRRSISSLGEPAPSDEQLDQILAAATRVPDHGALKPWRFVVVRDEGRAAFGDALADAARSQVADLPEKHQDKLRHKAFLAPIVVVVIASPTAGHKVPEWEQVASASCSGFALALAAHALGLGAVWKSANYLEGPLMTSLLSLTPAEQLLGWVAIGTPTKKDPRPPVVPSPADHVAILDGPQLRPY